jgi:3-isopropylmalate dehydratase
VFETAGFEWRLAGCSMCLGMNPDILSPGRALRFDLEPELRGAAGARGRTHLVSPVMAACRSDRRPLRRRPRLGRSGGVKAFHSATSSAAVLDRPDVDTDQIIPKQFLKRIERTGYGEFSSSTGGKTRTSS